MKLIDNILYIEFSELEACDIPRRTVLSWESVKDPQDKRKVLFQYEELKEKYQQLVIGKYGDPYTYVHNQVIKQFLRFDTAAHDYFSKLKPNDVALQADKIKQYVTCANWLNLLIDIENNWSKFKKVLCMNGKPELYNAVVKIFEAEHIKLPDTYQTLKRKIADYRAVRYECIASKKFGNSNSKKVKDELNKSLLLEMIQQSADFDYKFIATKYNLAAKMAGFKTISATTVSNYHKANAAYLDGYLYGKGVWYDKFGKSIPQKRPSAPLLQINSDDNDIDLYFKEMRIGADGDEKVASYWWRPCVMVIIDSFNDLILGYAIGETQTKALVYEAFLNAANYVKQLTGDHYLWRELKADSWNIKALKSFYEQQGNFTPPAVGNSRGKIIEQSFGNKWHATLKELYPTNYAGNNVTAKAKTNRDALEANKNHFPTKDAAAAHIAAFINRMRNLKDESTGKTKLQQWREAWECMQSQEKRLISPEQHLMWLGYEHTNKRTGALLSNTLTKEGITPAINGIEYIYEVPKDRYLDTLGMRVTLKYDPYDMSKVLATSKDGRTRFVCETMDRIPMALADHTTETRVALNNLLNEKKGHAKLIGDAHEHRLAALKKANMDAQGVLQAGVLVKEIKQGAERQLQQRSEVIIDEAPKKRASIYDRL